MASPQKENGFTPIANEIMEALARTRIPGEARQVLDIIIRKTYGFQKKEDRISLSQLCNGTGMKKPTVCKALNKLSTMNLITKKDNGEGNIFRFIKDFESWKSLPKKVTLPKKVMRVTQKGNNRYPKSHIQKKVLKETTTKETAQSAGTLGNEVIFSFKEINPSYESLFKRKSQHLAAERLVTLHGLERIKKIIDFIILRREDKYCPTITTPSQLEDKWAALEKYAVGLKEISTKQKIWL